MQTEMRVTTSIIPSSPRRLLCRWI